MKWWTDIRRKVLVEQVSKRQVMEEYRIHARTLEKILSNPEPPGYRMNTPPGRSPRSGHSGDASKRS